MIAGFIITTAVAGHYLDPFSPQRLVTVSLIVSWWPYPNACRVIWCRRSRRRQGGNARSNDGAQSGVSQGPRGHLGGASGAQIFNFCIRVDARLQLSGPYLGTICRQRIRHDAGAVDTAFPSSTAVYCSA